MFWWAGWRAGADGVEIFQGKHRKKLDPVRGFARAHPLERAPGGGSGRGRVTFQGKRRKKLDPVRGARNRRPRPVFNFRMLNF